MVLLLLRSLGIAGSFAWLSHTSGVSHWVLLHIKIMSSLNLKYSRLCCAFTAIIQVQLKFFFKVPWSYNGFEQAASLS